MSQPWGRGGGWCLYPGNGLGEWGGGQEGSNRYVRHAQGPRNRGHYQVLMND